VRRSDRRLLLEREKLDSRVNMKKDQRKDVLVWGMLGGHGPRGKGRCAWRAGDWPCCLCPVFCCLCYLGIHGPAAHTVTFPRKSASFSDVLSPKLDRPGPALAQLPDRSSCFRILLLLNTQKDNPGLSWSIGAAVMECYNLGGL
jgi:hypothetical protein